MNAPVRTLAASIRPYWSRIGVGIVFLVATNVTEKAIPWLFAHSLDALTGERLDDAKTFALIVIGLSAVMWVVRTASRVMIFNVGRDVEFDLRNQVLTKIHQLGPSFFRRMATGEIMSRATNDLAQVRLLVGFAGLNVVNSLLAFGSALALMIAISPSLTLWALAPYPLMVLVTRFFGGRIFESSLASQQSLATLADRANENVAGVRLVRAMAIEATELAKFEVANEGAVRATMRLVLLRGVMFPVLMAVASLGSLIVVWVGGQRVLAEELTVGEFFAFYAYVGLMVWPTLALGYLLSVLQRGRASYRRVGEILDAEPDIREVPDPKPADGPGALVVSGLRFEYADASGQKRTTILDDVSFEVPAGGSLAILGSTGSGKSTLAALLPRLLPTPKGAVFLDGVDITELSLAGLRDSVGFAQQEPFLFSTTVERNLALALDDATEEDAHERMREAASEACVLAEIESMQDGLKTVVGERGVQLSGGQKQRLALARALLNEPKVLVLDDPLSAVDAKTESSILDALDRAKQDRTFVLITNRVAAAARTDRVIVLDRGRVVERGTHDDLLDAGGLYARIAARQRLEAELAQL
ncbi:MAG: ABC transporter ATP-binding protein [Sandaracinaceae bacterium]